jgi:hypothetical protein
VRAPFHFAVFADVPEWRNWQTHAPDTSKPVTACGFESRFGHALIQRFDSAKLRFSIRSRVRCIVASLGWRQSPRTHTVRGFLHRICACFRYQRRVASEFLRNRTMYMGQNRSCVFDCPDIASFMILKETSTLPESPHCFRSIHARAARESSSVRHRTCSACT